MWTSVAENETTYQIPECKVEGEVGLHCLFPFFYNTKKYYGCTTFQEDPFTYWCPTKLNDELNMIDGSWGKCINCPYGNEQAERLLWHDPGKDYDQCQTLDSIPCQFPFIYEGTEFSECAKYLFEDVSIGFLHWCATRVNDGKELTEGEWGVCDPTKCKLEGFSLPEEKTGCKTTQGTPCRFPYKRRGRVMQGCYGERLENANNISLNYFCPTKLDRNNEEVEFGTCNPDCPRVLNNIL